MSILALSASPRLGQSAAAESLNKLDRGKADSLADSSFKACALSNLDRLEAEAAHILLETAATITPTALMFSGGKDSICLAHIIKKVFKDLADEAIPFKFIHYDSGDNFQEVLDFRDSLTAGLGITPQVYNVLEAHHAGLIKTALDGQGNVKALVELINYSQKELGLAGLIGGGRRDEDSVRAKERIFSVRDQTGLWQPQNQRPELWDCFNSLVNTGGHLRIFPISNWTERNVWEYIARENIALPSIYYAHERPVFSRNGTLMAYFSDSELRVGEEVQVKTVRCRTVGDRRTTGFIESQADQAWSVLSEIVDSKRSERAGRAEDQAADTGMESRKAAGWF
jgi:sulfate adenylyltransferase subunit 2